MNLLYINTAWKQKTSNHRSVVFLQAVCLSGLSAQDKPQLKILPEHKVFSIQSSHITVLADKMNQQMTSAFHSTV